MQDEPKVSSIWLQGRRGAHSESTKIGRCVECEKNRTKHRTLGHLICNLKWSIHESFHDDLLGAIRQARQKVRESSTLNFERLFRTSKKNGTTDTSLSKAAVESRRVRR